MLYSHRFIFVNQLVMMNTECALLIVQFRASSSFDTFLTGPLYRNRSRPIGDVASWPLHYVTFTDRNQPPKIYSIYAKCEALYSLSPSDTPTNKSSNLLRQVAEYSLLIRWQFVCEFMQTFRRHKRIDACVNGCFESANALWFYQT